jgi:hypothetical protein
MWPKDRKVGPTKLKAEVLLKVATINDSCMWSASLQLYVIRYMSLHYFCYFNFESILINWYIFDQLVNKNAKIYGMFPKQNHG